MKKALCLLALIGVLSSLTLAGKSLIEKIDKKLQSTIKKSITASQKKRDVRRARERESRAKGKMGTIKHPFDEEQPPELELWYKGYKKRGTSTTDLKPLYYKLGYTYPWDNKILLVTEGAFSEKAFRKIDPSERASSYLLDQDRWLLLSDKETPGPGDTIYKFAFPASRKMLIRLRLTEPREKPVHMMHLHGTSYVISPQTGPLKGLKGVTESGISLKDNVTDKEIIPQALTWQEVLELPLYDRKALSSIA